MVFKGLLEFGLQPSEIENLTFGQLLSIYYDPERKENGPKLSFKQVKKAVKKWRAEGL